VKTYKIKAPIGNIVVPKDKLNEDELRQFALQLVTTDDVAVWRDKILKDPIDEIAEWLRNLEYEIEEVK
jgi:hypothetical protein